MTLSAATLWLILAALLGIIELIATTFYLLVLGGRCASSRRCRMGLEWSLNGRFRFLP